MLCKCYKVIEVCAIRDLVIEDKITNNYNEWFKYIVASDKNSVLVDDQQCCHSQGISICILYTLSLAVYLLVLEGSDELTV